MITNKCRASVVRPVLAVMALTLCLGCATSKTPPMPSPILAEPTPQPYDPQANPASLFDPGQNRLLFEDNRARRVGDIVMVTVAEASSGKHKADTKSEKDSNLDIGVQNLFGYNTLFGASIGATPMVKAGTNTTLDATGETKRSSDLTATVGARVVRVLPGGVMQVEGARQMRINDETQILVVRGLVRGEDIASDNSVSSNKLANAQIEYYGQGVLADKQRPGWLTRILDNAWPF